MILEKYSDWIIEDTMASPYIKTFAVIGPRCSGSISILCSSLIINVILRSSTKLTSIYHRIIMGMAVTDIIGSAAIALTTFPFPKEDKWVDLYNYSGTRLGSYATCSAQGFLQFFGLTTAYLYNMMLCVYYACSLALSMEEKTIRKYEAFIHLVPTSVSISLALKILFNEGYNPAPRRSSWCTMTPLPYSCIDQPSPPPCERGSVESHKEIEQIFLVIAAAKMLVIIITLSMVCFKVAMLYCRVRKSRHGSERLTQQERTIAFGEFYVMRATFIQAISYILAIVITVLPPLVFISNSASAVSLVGGLYVILLPLQGMFNFFIFVGAKVYHLRRVNAETTLAQALYEIIWKKSFDDDGEALVFTGIQSALAHNVDLNSELESSSNPPTYYDNFRRDGSAVNSSSADISMEESTPSSAGAWEGVSFASRSTAVKSGGVSEGSFPAESMGAHSTAGDLSHSTKESSDVSHDVSHSTRKSIANSNDLSCSKK